MNWYIGQKVVCIQNDKIYVVLGVRESRCKCKTPELDVGLRGNHRTIGCDTCRTYGIPDETEISWKCSTLFRPLIDDHTDEELESVNIDELLEPLLEPA